MRTALRAIWLIIVLVGSPTLGLGQTQPEREIAESQRRLEQIRRERTQLREEMTRIRTRVSDLSGELTNVRGQVNASATLLRELEYQIQQRTEQINGNTSDLENTRALLLERKTVLNRRLRDIYKRGPLPVLQVLLAAESFSDLLNRYKYLQLVARYDRALAEEVAELEAQQVSRERVLRANLLEMEALRRDRTDEYSELSTLQRQQNLALTNVRTRERVTNERIQQLERDEASLLSLITTIESRRRVAESGRAGGAPAAAGPAVATLSASRMGSLNWPVEGQVLYRFGRTTQPNGTVVRWNGVGIAAPAGSPVHAVEGGTVVLAGPFEGYGPTVVLSHGGGYYSLYLYLQQVGVTEGQVVTAAQRLGSVGGERTTEGAHIEFQIRTPGGQAVDPLTWLRRQ